MADSDGDNSSPLPVSQILHLAFPENVENPIEINLLVDASPGCGGRAWPAGETLASYLVRHRSQRMYDQTVLELGSGTGLVGLVTAKMGAQHVCITDQIPLLPIMRQNVHLNQFSSGEMSVAELNWGEPVPASLQHPTLILAADCVYFEPAFPLLVKTLVDICDGGAHPEILFCYKKRRKADKRFFALLKKAFTWEPVPDELRSIEYNRESIYLYTLHRRGTKSVEFQT